MVAQALTLSEKTEKIKRIDPFMSNPVIGFFK